MHDPRQDERASPPRDFDVVPGRHEANDDLNETGMKDTPDREATDDLGFTIAVGLLQADLILPLCRSLKDKRGILAKTMNHLRRKHGVSVAEVSEQNTWGRAGLAVTSVSGTRSVAEQTLRQVARSLEREREVQLIDWSIEIL